MKRVLLSYLTPEEKHQLVGSFVIENFWDTFNQINFESINTFRDIAKKSIQSFIVAYQDVWDYVVDINLLDDIFLTESIKANKKFCGLSLNELRATSKLLSLSLYSELEKDCLMALNKTILTELASDLRKRYQFSDEDFQLLMTPSFETFFTKYHFDHFEYAINNNPVSKSEQREQLIVNYHASDPELFDLRFDKMHFSTGNNLVELFTMQRNSITEKSAKKIAFIGENEELKAFEKLLEYDNFLDFKYRYNLEACPEYYIRKLLFAECQAHGIFEDVPKPLTLEDGEFIEGVNKLITLVEKTYTIKLGINFDLSDYSDVAQPIHISIESILNHLKKGSPCLLKKTGFTEEILIIGYEEGALLGQTNDKEIRLTVDNLKSFEECIVLQKYSEEFIEDINKSIKKFIDRTPLLNRKIYEKAFSSEHHNNQGN